MEPVTTTYGHLVTLTSRDQSRLLWHYTNPSCKEWLSWVSSKKNKNIHFKTLSHTTTRINLVCFSNSLSLIFTSTKWILIKHSSLVFDEI